MQLTNLLGIGLTMVEALVYVSVCFTLRWLQKKCKYINNSILIESQLTITSIKLSEILTGQWFFADTLFYIKTTATFNHLSASHWYQMLLSTKCVPFFRYFPSQGEQVYIFMTDSVLPGELSNIGVMVDKLRGQTDIITSVDSWHTAFKDYYENNFMEIDGN